MTEIKETHLSQMDEAQRERIAMLKAQIERPHNRVMYGRNVRVEPVFCETIIGDGAVLLNVTPVQTAPAYHCILVDSSWVRPCNRPFACDGIEPELDDDQHDLLVSVIKERCGDADIWHEEHGDHAFAPHGYFHADMGYYLGAELLTFDGQINPEHVPA